MRRFLCRDGVYDPELRCKGNQCFICANDEAAMTTAYEAVTRGAMREPADEMALVEQAERLVEGKSYKPATVRRIVSGLLWMLEHERNRE